MFRRKNNIAITLVLAFALCAGTASAATRTITIRVTGMT